MTAGNSSSRLRRRRYSPGDFLRNRNYLGDFSLVASIRKLFHDSSEIDKANEGVYQDNYLRTWNQLSLRFDMRNGLYVLVK